MKSAIIYPILFSFLFLCFTPHFNTASAQDLLAELKLEGDFGQVGDEVAVIDDMNNDQVIDLLVAGGEAQGVFIYSGAEGSILQFVSLGPDPAVSLTALGDVNNDSVIDWAAGTTNKVRAFSGADGAELWSVAGDPGDALGVTLAAVGDANNDTIPDLAAGAPFADPGGKQYAGEIRVLSGADGSLIRKFKGRRVNQTLGRVMEPIRDLNNDNRDDLIIGEPDYSQPGSNTGRVYVMSAYDGAVILNINGTAANGFFGYTVADAGLLDGDNLHDLAIATLNPNNIVQAFSSATLKELWASKVKKPNNILSLGDTNGDNIPELAMGAPGFSVHSPDYGYGHILDGATGDVIKAFTGPTFGSFENMAAPGDLDGDGWPEFVYGSAPEYFNSEGFVKAYSPFLQSELYTIDNPAGNDFLGVAVGRVGDLDKDQVEDYFVASIKRIVIFSGATETPLFNVKTNENVIFNSPDTVIALDDLNSDDVPDFAVGNYSWSNYRGRVQIYSGADGQVLGTITGNVSDALGYALETTVDHNNDGVRDFYVTLLKPLQGQSSAGQVQLRDGATLAVLDTFETTPQMNGAFGTTLSADHDLDGDGIPDLAVGSSMDVVPGSTTGALYLISSVTGDELFRIDGDNGSYTVYGAIMGDADGDGVNDVIAAEPLWMKPGDPFDSDRGRVRLFSGESHGQLWQAEGTTISDEFGWDAAGAGDVNGDGYADVALSVPGDGLGDKKLLFLSGTDGAILDEIILPAEASQIAAAGYYDEGASCDVLVGMRDFAVNGGARIYASSLGGIHGFKDLGHSLAGTGGLAPTLHGYGELSGGGHIIIKVRDGLPSTTGFWFYSLGQTAIPVRGGIFVPDPSTVFFTLPVATNGNGEYTLTGVNPLGIPSGLSLYHQFWFNDPGAVQAASATNAMEETFK